MMLVQRINEQYANTPIEELSTAGVINLLKTYRLTYAERDERFSRLRDRLSILGFPKEAEVIGALEQPKIELRRDWGSNFHDDQVLIDTRLTSAPRVSVVTSYFNEGPSIVEKLGSFLEQSLYQQQQCEFIIVDSSSPGGEANLLVQSLAKQANILLLRTPYREWLYAAMNRGASHARGKYLCFSSVNDFLTEGALADMADALDQAPQYDWLQADVIRSDGEPQINTATDNFTVSMLFWSAYMTLSSQLITKQAFEDIGGFDPTYRCAGDTDLKMRVSQACKVMHLPKPAAKVFIDDAPRLTVSPVAEIEDFRAWFAYRHPLHIASLEKEEILCLGQSPAERLFRIGLNALNWIHPNSKGREHADVTLALRYLQTARSLGLENPILDHNLRQLISLVTAYNYIHTKPGSDLNQVTQAHHQINAAMNSLLDENGQALKLGERWQPKEYWPEIWEEK